MAWACPGARAVPEKKVITHLPSGLKPKKEVLEEMGYFERDTIITFPKKGTVSPPHVCHWRIEALPLSLSAR